MALNDTEYHPVEVCLPGGAVPNQVEEPAPVVGLEIRRLVGGKALAPFPGKMFLRNTRDIVRSDRPITTPRFPFKTWRPVCIISPGIRPWARPATIPTAAGPMRSLVPQLHSLVPSVLSVVCLGRDVESRVPTVLRQ